VLIKESNIYKSEKYGGINKIKDIVLWNQTFDFQNNFDVRIDPYSLFFHAMKSPLTKKKYSRRLEIFFNFINIPGESLEERCLTFVNNGKDNIN